jgi:hypothetical protein
LGERAKKQQLKKGAAVEEEAEDLGDGKMERSPRACTTSFLLTLSLNPHFIWRANDLFSLNERVTPLQRMVFGNTLDALHSCLTNAFPYSTMEERSANRLFPEHRNYRTPPKEYLKITRRGAKEVVSRLCDTVG